MSRARALSVVSRARAILWAFCTTNLAAFSLLRDLRPLLSRRMRSRRHTNRWGLLSEQCGHCRDIRSSNLLAAHRSSWRPDLSSAGTLECGGYGHMIQRLENALSGARAQDIIKVTNNSNGIIGVRVLELVVLSFVDDGTPTSLEGQFDGRSNR